MVAPRPRIVVLTGPTAAGKTGIGVALAEQLDAEIVSADSQQVYRFMDVGTAKPTAEDRARVPHHLIDVVDPDVQYDAARYADDAARAIDAILSRGHAVLVVGGTGLYIRAALEGLTSGPGRDPELRARLEEEDAAARARGDTSLLHRRLAKVDPETAERLHPNDKVRIIRALEIQVHTGRAASERTEKREPRYDALQIAIDPGREPLIQRIDARCDAMIEGGLLQEVRALRERGYGPELPSMRAIGYRHMQPVVEGLETLANVREQMKHDTRQFARRQRTWLRRVEGALWCRPEETSRIRAEAVAWLAG
jgi:tRNA dimethylallyltransferase